MNKAESCSRPTDYHLPGRNDSWKFLWATGLQEQSDQSDGLACPCLAMSRSGQSPQAESSRLLSNLASRWVCQQKVHMQQNCKRCPAKLRPRKRSDFISFKFLPWTPPKSGNLKFEWNRLLDGLKVCRASRKAVVASSCWTSVALRLSPHMPSYLNAAWSPILEPAPLGIQASLNFPPLSPNFLNEVTVLEEQQLYIFLCLKRFKTGI